MIGIRIVCLDRRGWCWRFVRVVCGGDLGGGRLERGGVFVEHMMVGVGIVGWMVEC